MSTSSTYTKQFRAKAQARLAKRGWTNRRLALRCGLSETTVHGILNGSGEIHYGKARLIEDALAGRINNEEGA